MIYGPHKAKRRTLTQWVQFLLNTFRKVWYRGVRRHVSGYECPTCTMFPCDDDEDNLLYRSKGRPHTSMECMGTVHDWDERWQCENCGTVYEFVNSDY